MNDQKRSISQKTIVRAIGFLYLFIIVSSLISAMFVEAELIIPGDTTTTVTNIMEQERLFRFGVVNDLIMFMSVAALAVALYALLKPVSKELALLALCWRLIESGIGAVTILVSFIILQLLSGDAYLSAFETPELHALIQVFLNVRTAAYSLVLMSVGLGSVVVFYIFLKSQFIPSWVALAGILAYGLMVGYTLVKMMTINDGGMLMTNTAELVSYMPVTVFELFFGIWLLTRGTNSKLIKHSQALADI